MERSEAVFAEALARAHAALLDAMRRLEEAAAPTSAEGLEGLRGRLGATQAHLLEHFRFEEHDGYMDAVRKQEPRLERAVQQLAEEHRELAQSLEALLGKARAATHLSAALQADVRSWVEHVRRHEVRENDVVQNAFNVDIGAKD